MDIGPQVLKVGGSDHFDNSLCQRINAQIAENGKSEVSIE